MEQLGVAVLQQTRQQKKLPPPEIVEGILNFAKHKR